MTMRRIVGHILLLAVLLNCGPRVSACSPDTLEPVFVFDGSPDPPFVDFTRGKLGILQPKMGRKTLFIAFRYISGGSFTGEEQHALLDALNGKAPDDKGDDAVKAWIEARKQVVAKDEELPTIYAEREYGGYEFFPNCTRSGFETAIETLRDRIASYGVEDPNVRAWLTAQDTVFQNCAGGSSIPQELGADSAEWLRKDRDYQIAAAYFYSLNFEQARDRFERIVTDNESSWRDTADYLIARTLVRQASLTGDETAKQSIYEHAERHLQLLIGSGGKFLNASQKLMALIDYRLRPMERVGELARILAYQNGNENLRQDLIDYVWLLDKFEAQVIQEEVKRQQELSRGKSADETEVNDGRSETYNAIEKGELIGLWFVPKSADGEKEYGKYVYITVPPETSENEILDMFAKSLTRKLTPEEAGEIKKLRDEALDRLAWIRAPNQQLTKVYRSQYEGDYYYGGEKPAFDLFPAFLRSDELSDWILTFQNSDPKAYDHALARWRQTDSVTWLVTALSKAQSTSLQLERLLKYAEKVPRDSTAYPTVAFNLIRLKIARGKPTEARALLDNVLSSGADLLPASAMNQFLELGTQLASNMNEFLKFAQRKPAAFYEFGRFGTIKDILKIEKSHWDPQWSRQTKEEFEQEIEDSYKDLLPLDDRFTFDVKMTDILNTHFPLAEFADAARNPALPDYLQVRTLLAVWTRAILLSNEKIASRVARELISLEPKMEPVLTPYLIARTTEERKYAALYIILRSPYLSPFIKTSGWGYDSAEELNYYFELSWWCKPYDTEYDLSGNEVKKNIAKPRFLTSEQLESAKREIAELVAIGNAKSYLGKRVVEWAKKSPGDVRIPEALFIAVRANVSFKNGCDSWETDDKTRNDAETLLRTRYPDSPWTGKLTADDK